MYYQTDAAVDSGSSGGPVCNTKNQVIGILVQGFEKQGFKLFPAIRIYYSDVHENGVKLGGSVGSILPF
jgi:V8-like Glu-specific endopeptidase